MMSLYGCSLITCYKTSQRKIHLWVKGDIKRIEKTYMYNITAVVGINHTKYYDVVENINNDVVIVNNTPALKTLLGEAT